MTGGTREAYTRKGLVVERGGVPEEVYRRHGGRDKGRVIEDGKGRESKEGKERAVKEES